MAMRLKWIETVGRKDDGAPARGQHAHNLGGGHGVIIDVLQHLVTQHKVEAAIAIRQLLAQSQCIARFGHVDSGNFQMFGLNVNAMHRVAVWLQRMRVHAHAAAVNEHIAQRAIGARACPAQDQIEAALLPCAPHHAGVAALCRAFAMQFENFCRVECHWMSQSRIDD